MQQKHRSQCNDSWTWGENAKQTGWTEHWIILISHGCCKGRTAPVKPRESDFAIITMQHSDGATKGFMSVDERKREFSWRAHIEMTCKSCHGLAMRYYGKDRVKGPTWAISQHAGLY